MPALNSRAAASSTSEQVLDIVAGLVGELTGDKTRRPALGDSLDRDLGISSLERVELLIRLEQAFGVRLPDRTMAEAATPQDLVEALRQAVPGAVEGRVKPTPVVSTPSARPTIPTTARSLVEVLHWHAERTPDRVHVHLRNEDDSETPLTYGELATTASAVAGGLQTLGVAKGDRVAVMLRTERAFFETFWGALLLGAVPVPLYPPVRPDDVLAYMQRQQQILQNAGARVLVTFADAARFGALMRGQAPSLEAVTTATDLVARGATAALPRASQDDAALIQYTSGSTGDPKGVLLSHANILANVRVIGEAFEIRPDDVAVSWLPLYHDMGLIGLWLGSLYFGVPLAIMSPLAFLSRPSRWLWALHEHGGTISAAPNFAFDLCARRIRDEELTGLDLSRWRIAVNGSEAVRADTIARFVHRFGPHGFRAEALCPAYGLAESSVALTLSPPHRGPRVDRVDRPSFERDRTIGPAPPDDSRALHFVSCGRPLQHHDVRIVDRADRPVVDRVEGRIQFRGPSVTAGYFRNPEATRVAMRSDWMASGDLGYLADGELFITGREKDLIIQGGRNICAEEVEAITSSVAGIRPSCVAAFGVPDSATGTERVIVIAETREPSRDKQEALQRAVRDALVTGIGAPPDVVVIAPPRTVLKTPSGKIRRSAMRQAYLAGTLGARPSIAVQRARVLASACRGWLRRLIAWLGDVIFTGWVLLTLVVSLPALWAYLATRPPGGHADRAVRWWSRFTLMVCGLRPQVVGLEHLRGLRSGVLVANHASYIDPIVVMAAVPVPFHFVAKRALTRYPLIGTVIRKAEHLTIEKAGLSDRLAGADEVARQLRTGGRLFVFPEGTFEERPELLPFRLGAFRAAVDTGQPIVPIALAGTRHVLSADSWLFRRSPLTVTIGLPLSPQAEGWPEMVRLRDAAVAHVARAGGESAFAPQTGE